MIQEKVEQENLDLNVVMLIVCLMLLNINLNPIIGSSYNFTRSFKIYFSTLG